MILRAYVDESEPDQRYDPGCYLLAAAIVPAGFADHARRVLCEFRSAGPKAHWTKESDRRRKQISEALAALDLVHLVVVRADAHESSERRRRMCLRTLFSILDELHVDEVMFEARERRQNEGDLRVWKVLRSEHLVTERLRVAHRPGRTEPLLWIPDMLGGVVGAYRRGESSYFDCFGGRIRIVDA